MATARKASEVCINAIETGLIGTFEFHARGDMTLEWPMAETPTHVITMGFHPDLDDCVVIALCDMIKLISGRTGISREDASRWSLAAAFVSPSGGRFEGHPHHAREALRPHQ